MSVKKIKILRNIHPKPAQDYTKTRATFLPNLRRFSSLLAYLFKASCLYSIHNTLAWTVIDRSRFY